VTTQTKISDHALSVRNVFAGYEKKETIRNISFDIPKNKIVGLVGLNGAGKTTLIKTIVGLRDFQKGDIEKSNDQIAFLPERFEAPAFLTGFEFIEFHLKSYKKTISREQVEEYANNISFDLKALDKRIKTYSKGMRQKIGVLATLMAECDLTILDEPMSGLDPKARHDVKQLITAATEKGQSIFMSSHALNDVSSLCDTVIIIHKGEIVFSGAVRDMLEQSKDQDIEKAFLNIIEEK